MTLLVKPLATAMLLPALLACLGAAKPAVLTPDGYGAVRIGMTHAQASRALGVPIKPDSFDASDTCSEDQVVGGKPGLWFMFEDGRLTRIVTDEKSAARTDSGIGLGDSEAKVRKIYGKAVKQERAPYMDPPWKDLYVWRSKDRGLRFELDDHGRVASIFAGTASIQYSEGCA